MKLINSDNLLFQFLLWSVRDGSGALQKTLVVKSLSPSAKDAGNARHAVWSLGWGDPLEDGMATLSSILARRIPWTAEPCRLQSTGSQTQLKWLSTPTRTKVRWIQLKADRLWQQQVGIVNPQSVWSEPHPRRLELPQLQKEKNEPSGLILL